MSDPDIPKPRKVWDAEAAELKARAAKEEMLARKYAAEAASAEYAVKNDYLESLARQRTENEYLAGDFENHVLRFTDGVEEESVGRAIHLLSQFHRLDPKCNITVVFNSPGGSVIDGMALFDHIRYLAKQGHKITTIAQGMAASMAGVLLQAGDYRIMGRESFLLIHEVSALAWGRTGEIEDEVELLKKMNSRILDIFAARSTLSKKSLEARWRRKDWYLDSREAMKYGFADEVEGEEVPKATSKQATKPITKTTTKSKKGKNGV